MTGDTPGRRSLRRCGDRTALPDGEQFPGAGAVAARSHSGEQALAGAVLGGPEAGGRVGRW
ncbi:hypothetical protein ACFWOL_12000 [Streptomyces sp. NPDC058442]|uniref:hypothetical protein n=1 Tax=Streptomyces sp. NPDC058442 TaxID=3346503 RepID=UPI0036469B4E